MSALLLKCVRFSGKDYKRLKRCGRGGEATVYEVVGAKDSLGSKIVAKAFTPKKNGSSTPSRYKRFRESALEIINLKKVSGGGNGNGGPFPLVEILDDYYLPEDYSPSLEQAPYFLMRYLTAWKDVNLNYLETIDCLLQILDSIDYLHKHYMTHRDIKAGNILLDIDGKWKLSDYGMLCFEHEDGLDTNTGESMMIYGGPPELRSISSYESFADKYQVFVKSDIYLFGKLCWQLLLKEGLFFMGEFSLLSQAAKSFFDSLGDKGIPFGPVLELMEKSILYDFDERCDSKTARSLLLKQKRLCEMFYGEALRKEEYYREMDLFKRVQIKYRAKQGELIVWKESLINVLSGFGISNMFKWIIVNDPIDLPSSTFSVRLIPKTAELFFFSKAGYDYSIIPAYVIIPEKQEYLFEVHLKSIEIKRSGNVVFSNGDVKENISLRCLGIDHRLPL